MDDSLIKMMNEVWGRRLNGAGDTIHAFIIHTTTSVPNPNNPIDFKRPPSSGTDHVFDELLGGWQSTLQMSPEGLHIDLKTGICAIPHVRFNTSCEAIKDLIRQKGSSCTFDGEPVEVQLVEEDPYANTTVIHMERTGA